MSETVEEIQGGIVLDDAVQDTPSNVAEEQPEGPSISEVLEQKEPAKEPAKEPGWVKKRIESALEKRLPELLAAEREKLRAEYDLRLKPLLEAQMERDAADLVAQGEFKSKDRALEYLRLKQGVPAPQAVPQSASNEVSRNERGQFAKPDPEVRERAARLFAQAEYALEMDGIDAMEIYRTDAEVARKVNSGEWDFKDVVRAVKAAQSVPPPIRSSNAAMPQKRGPMDLSKEEFRKLNDNLAKGVKVDMRR